MISEGLGVQTKPSSDALLAKTTLLSFECLKDIKD